MGPGPASGAAQARERTGMLSSLPRAAISRSIASATSLGSSVRIAVRVSTWARRARSSATVRASSSRRNIASTSGIEVQGVVCRPCAAWLGLVFMDHLAARTCLHVAVDDLQRGLVSRRRCDGQRILAERRHGTHARRHQLLRQFFEWPGRAVCHRRAGRAPAL